MLQCGDAAGDAEQACGHGERGQWLCRHARSGIDDEHGDIDDEDQGGDGDRRSQCGSRIGLGDPADQAAGGGEDCCGGGDRDGDQRDDRDRYQEGDRAGVPRVRMEQQQPPDAHEGSGDDVGGDGASRVGGGQLSGERVRDCFRCTELTDGSPDGFGFGESVGDVVADGVIEAVAEFGTNLLAATAVTAVENCSQMARCSPRAARPDGVRW